MSLNSFDWKFPVVLACFVIAIFALRRTSFVPLEKARQLLREGAVVIDVRTAEEFRSGHLPGAINIPLGDLNELPRQVPDKNRILLLHCLSGTRSGIARQKLKSMGYPNSYNLGSYGRAEGIVGRPN